MTKVCAVSFILLFSFVVNLCALDPDSLNAVNKFTSQFGEGFIVHWDKSAKTYHRILGRGIQLKEGGFSKSSDAIKSFEFFLKENSKLFKVNLENLRLTQVDSSGASDWYFGYRQYYHGLPVPYTNFGATKDSEENTISLKRDIESAKSQNIDSSKTNKGIKVNIEWAVAYHIFKGRLIPPPCSYPPNMFSLMNFRGELNFSEKAGIEICLHHFSFVGNFPSPCYMTSRFCRESLANLNFKYYFYNHHKLIPYVKGGGHLRAIRFQALIWDGTTIASWTYYFGITNGFGLIYNLQSKPFKLAIFLDAEHHLSLPLLLEFNHFALNLGISLSLWR